MGQVYTFEGMKKRSVCGASSVSVATTKTGKAKTTVR